MFYQFNAVLVCIPVKGKKPDALKAYAFFHRIIDNILVHLPEYSVEREGKSHA